MNHIRCLGSKPVRGEGGDGKSGDLSCLLLDLHRQAARRGVMFKDPVSHPQKTVSAMRLLSAISDHTTRVKVTHNLYRVSVVCNLFDQQMDVTPVCLLVPQHGRGEEGGGGGSEPVSQSTCGSPH
jgi:hypothetical protein